MSVRLTRIEKKVLTAICRYSYADVGLLELNGYLHFPPVESILAAVGELEREGLIELKGPPFHGYQSTEKGNQYWRRAPLFSSRFALSLREILIAAIGSAIGGIIVACVTR